MSSQSASNRKEERREAFNKFKKKHLPDADNDKLLRLQYLSMIEHQELLKIVCNEANMYPAGETNNKITSFINAIDEVSKLASAFPTSVRIYIQNTIQKAIQQAYSEHTEFPDDYANSDDLDGLVLELIAFNDASESIDGFRSKLINDVLDNIPKPNQTDWRTEYKLTDVYVIDKLRAVWEQTVDLETKHFLDKHKPINTDHPYINYLQDFFDLLNMKRVVKKDTEVEGPSYAAPQGRESWKLATHDLRVALENYRNKDLRDKLSFGRYRP